jgi:hypothetical protein
MTIECKVSCFDTEIEELTGTKTDLWLPACIDMRHIIAIKNNYEDGELTDRTVIYFSHGDYFIIDRPYNEVLKLFLESR